jgi:hypothetical protein
MTLAPDPLRLMEDAETTALMRPASVLMRPERLAAIQPSRLSASRALINRAATERWQITRKQFAVEATGKGIAEYRIDTGSMVLSFPVYSFEPSPHGRTGRIIGRAWDMMGALVEGDMSAANFETTRQELPKLYRGRATPGTLVWCRSNRSGRAFRRTQSALERGEQPAIRDIAETCYVMRNTGLDGNGTFGTRSFVALETGHPLRPSLSAQMLCAYMMRVFAADIIEHLAAEAAPGAARLNSDVARFLGVGNGSALGLMLYVNNHPRLVDRWLGARERCIARASGLELAEAQLDLLLKLVERAIRFRREDRAAYENATPSSVVADDLEVVRAALIDCRNRKRAGGFDHVRLRDLPRTYARPIGMDAEETLNSLSIELVPDLADGLVHTLVVDEELRPRPEETVASLRDRLHSDYGWVFDLGIDPEIPGPYVWYKSVTAEEPRRGLGSEAPSGTINLGLDLPRLVLALERDLADSDASQSVARFLLTHPHHRAIATRVQTLADCSYHSPEADIMSPDFVPAHITRLLNVGIHGIDKARDFLNRNLRGVLFHGAPLPADIASGSADPFWFNPAEPAQ